ncbi:cupin domain-containing protein [Pseudoxanthomonas composti]|uniref:ChrR-like cupin domain-containing protein n=1 Tax=Pseudoxanthomonas composti TaxID=2137479 RepID=A0A4Q1JXE7_9GAMM|nr:cupin domain-containing protein [Pseudoxanthomonas composti]RXR06460.1 hypothetical protein EPA99_07380 [Pseudoxanthomonas composti]
MIKSLMLLLLSSLPVVSAAQDTPGDWSPDSVDWQDISADGTRYRLLEGERERPGAAFSYAFFVPAGAWDAPHSHSTTARIFVARGELRLGYGERMDKVAVKAYPAGSYLVVPAGMVHFDGAESDTLIFGTASGPWKTTYTDRGHATAGTPAD